MTHLGKLISSIKENEILLPDFQRKFVWTDIDRQKRLIASVLAQLPIGSILLLEGNSAEFVSKSIGKKTSIQTDVNESKYYLLDGQQRMTVLTNAFSNAIYYKLDSWHELMSPSLKARFYLEFPNVQTDLIENDLFGISDFSFPFDSFSSEPNFLNEHILEYIENYNTRAGDNHVFNPLNNLKDFQYKINLSNFCIYGDRIKIPLFLLGENLGTVVDRLLKEISNRRQTFLIEVYENEPNRIEDIFRNSSSFNLSLMKAEDDFKSYIDQVASDWVNSMHAYLNKCINELNVQMIHIGQSQRGRAIDIYENLNLGGISLNTFDLIIARAAIEMRDGFYDCFINEIKKPIKLSTQLLNGVKLDGWNSVDRMNSYSENKTQVSNMVINVFLNLLSLTSINKNEYNNFFDFEFEIDYIKREKQLSVSPKDIVSLYPGLVTSINRALAFLQIRCGIRKIDELNYEHVLLVLSHFLGNDRVYECSETLNLLEYWYWTSSFGGKYDKDQTNQVIQDLKRLSSAIGNMLRDHNDESMLNVIKDYKKTVFSDHYFTNKEILLMKEAYLETYPKDVIRKLVTQFILSKRPNDFIQSNYTLHAWDKDFVYEYHHIIPLKSLRALDGSEVEVKSIEESKKLLRNDKSNILNSPLNFTLILPATNNYISNASPQTYFSLITGVDRFKHIMPDNALQNSPDWLEARYEMFKNVLLSHLDNLLPNL